MPIFDFNSISPSLQQWLPIITETSNIQCSMVIPQVLDENRSLFFILHLNVQFELQNVQFDLKNVQFDM